MEWARIGSEKDNAFISNRTHYSSGKLRTLTLWFREFGRKIHCVGVEANFSDGSRFRRIGNWYRNSAWPVGCTTETGKLLRAGYTWLDGGVLNCGSAPERVFVEFSDGKIDTGYCPNIRSYNFTVTCIKTRGGDIMDKIWLGCHNKEFDNPPPYYPPNPPSGNNNPTPSGGMGCSCSEIQEKLNKQTTALITRAEEDRRHLANLINQIRRIVEDNGSTTELQGELERILGNQSRIINRIDEIHDNQMADILFKLNKILKQQQQGKGTSKEELEQFKQEIINSQEKAKEEIKGEINKVPVAKDSTQDLKDFITNNTMPKSCCEELKTLINSTGNKIDNIKVDTTPIENSIAEVKKDTEFIKEKVEKL